MRKDGVVFVNAVIMCFLLLAPQVHAESKDAPSFSGDGKKMRLPERYAIPEVDISRWQSTYREVPGKQLFNAYRNVVMKGEIKSALGRQALTVYLAPLGTKGGSEMWVYSGWPGWRTIKPGSEVMKCVEQVEMSTDKQLVLQCMGQAYLKGNTYKLQLGADKVYFEALKSGTSGYMEEVGKLPFQ